MPDALRKVLTIVGARPQFIKCAPVSRCLREHVHEVLVHTGQHYDESMSKVFFDALDIPEPNHNLEVGSGAHGFQTGEMLKRIEMVLLDESPDWVIVYGDTNSTVAGALAAAKLQIPVAHIEAGLRSYNRTMPEELNRVITDHLSTLLFCPTETAVTNLGLENITRGVVRVGDVMQDAMLHNLDKVDSQSDILKTLSLNPQEYSLVTIHRPGNTDDPEVLGHIFTALLTLADDKKLVFPVHPRTQQRLRELQVTPHENITMLEPVSYLDMLALERDAAFILTDSGGVQKEAYWLKVPCVTLRDETEWTETVDSGCNVLAGTAPFRIINAVQQMMTRRGNFAPSNYQAGEATGKIVETLLAYQGGK